MLILQTKKCLQYYFIYYERRLKMKKSSAPQNKKNTQATKAENKAMENIKYEVAQEMGIKPTKNKKS